jgi:acyl-CoA thioester hydrolase
VSAAPPALQGCPIIIELPIAWGEMDSFQHVNNIVYFRWFESARIAYFDAVQFRDPEANDGVGPILHSTRARFRRALTYPDTVLVGTRVSGMEPGRFTMEYRVFSRAFGEIAAEGTGVIVPFNYRAGKKAELPAAVAERIRLLERV